jgi:hypothetical protein
MALGPYTLVMADEDSVLEEVMDNLKEAGQRIRATQSLMRSQGMTDGENHRDLLSRLSTALAMTEAAYLEARRRRSLASRRQFSIQAVASLSGVARCCVDPNALEWGYRLFLAVWERGHAESYIRSSENSLPCTKGE